MKGSIRLLVGFLITFGSVGHMDYDPNADLLFQTLLAAVGLLIMWSGVRAMNRSY